MLGNYLVNKAHVFPPTQLFPMMLMCLSVSVLCDDDVQESREKEWDTKKRKMKEKGIHFLWEMS